MRAYLSAGLTALTFLTHSLVLQVGALKEWSTSQMHSDLLFLRANAQVIMMKKDALIQFRAILIMTMIKILFAVVIYHLQLFFHL